MILLFRAKREKRMLRCKVSKLLKDTIPCLKLISVGTNYDFYKKNSDPAKTEPVEAVVNVSLQF